MSLENSSWVEEGTARDALNALCSRPDVLTEEFHRVYERVLGDKDLLAEDPAARLLLEGLLHVDGTFDVALMNQGRISTVSISEELAVPAEAVNEEGSTYDVAGRRAWASQHRDLPGTFAKLSARHARGYF